MKASDRDRAVRIASRIGATWCTPKNPRCADCPFGEICVAKKPTVFVPYPFAAEDHQTVNAQHLVQKNAALLVKDSEANAQLVTTALQLLSNPTLQKNMQLQMEKLAIANADETIATSILNYLNGK